MELLQKNQTWKLVILPKEKKWLYVNGLTGKKAITEYKQQKFKSSLGKEYCKKED